MMPETQRIRLVVVAILSSTLSGSAFAQFNADASLRFEAATVKPIADPFDGKLDVVGPLLSTLGDPAEIPMPNPGLVRFRNVSLIWLIAVAFQTPQNQISGPGWMSGTDYAVEAKVAPGSSREEIRAMLRNLLVDRFHMVAHIDSRPTQGLVLHVEKGGSKLVAATIPEQGNENQEKARSDLMAGFAVRAANASRLAGEGMSRLRYSRVSMHSFADILATLLSQPVADETGLTGVYDVLLEYPTDEREDGIAHAVRKLGLRLDRAGVTQKIVVISSISRTPTAD